MRRRALAAVLAIVAGCGGHAPTPTEIAAPPTALAWSGTLREPPMQGLPFPTPAAWSEEQADVVRRHLALGLPDHRGCVPREVVLTIGNDLTSATRLIRTIAWWIPESGEPGTVIASNGLLYDATVLGAPSTHVAAEVIVRGPSEIEESHWGEMSALASELRAPIELALEPPRDDGTAIVWVAAESSYARALSAHMRGDEPLALRSAEDARRWGDAVHLFASESQTSASPDDVALASFQAQWFLSYELDILLRDHQRRAASARPDVPAALATTGTPRAAALIAVMDQIGGDQYNWPGAPAVHEDPIYRALASLGLDAVDGLVEAAESDERLTRAVRAFRPFVGHRTLVTVAHVASLLVSEILGLPHRRFAPGALRALWRSIASADALHRALALLTTDDTRGQWAPAALALTEETTPCAPSDEAFPLPSVASAHADALADDERERLISTIDARLAETASAGDLTSACSLADALTRLEGPAAVDALRSTTTACVASPHCSCATRLLIARRRLGDAAAMGEWQARITSGASTLHPELASEGWALAPAWLFPDDPAVHAAMTALAGRWSEWALELGGGGALDTPFATLPPVRDALVEALRDLRPWGDGDRARYRRADVLASMLARREGAPAFDPEGSVAARDEQLAAMRGYVDALQPPPPAGVEPRCGATPRW